MPEYLDYQPDFDAPEVVSIFDELSFWSSRFGALLLDNIPIRKNTSILDLACGAGFPLFEIAHTFGDSCQVTGVDV